MPKLRDRIRSTFPIPASKIRARKLKAVLGSPITWAPYLPVVGAYTLLDVGPALFATLAIVVTGGLVAYWRSHTRKIEDKVLDQLVKESNQEQDLHLVSSARSLMARGYAPYAQTLGSFLERKQRIEHALHSDGDGLTSEKREMESLTDTVVFGIADQLNRLVQLDERITRSAIPPLPAERERIEAAREEIGLRIHEAYALLDETWKNLGLILNPAAGIGAEDTSHHSLDSALSRLREEKEIAHRIHDRMVHDFGAIVPDDPVSREGGQDQVASSSPPPLETEG